MLLIHFILLVLLSSMITHVTALFADRIMITPLRDKCFRGCKNLIPTSTARAADDVVASSSQTGSGYNKPDALATATSTPRGYTTVSTITPACRQTIPSSDLPLCFMTVHQLQLRGYTNTCMYLNMHK